MKKYLIKMMALLVLASFVLSSCSVEYRENHRHHYDDHHDHDHNYHNY